jgi:hypothetical protein
MIELDPSALIGKGLHRECFMHPLDPGLCIKIVVAGSINENHREARYYHHLAKRDISWEMLTRFHGLVDTNLGEGAVFDLVRDYNGQVSATLACYLESTTPDASVAAALSDALARLKAYLLENRVITMTLKPKNILFRLDGPDSGTLVIVDNIGNSDFVPLADYSAALARRKIRRKWCRFEASLLSLYPGNKILPRLLGNAQATR